MGSALGNVPHRALVSVCSEVSLPHFLFEFLGWLYREDRLSTVSTERQRKACHRDLWVAASLLVNQLAPGNQKHVLRSVVLKIPGSVWYSRGN